MQSLATRAQILAPLSGIVNRDDYGGELTPRAARVSPAPSGSSGGIDTGRCALIGLSPSTALAAARCVVTMPPHATMYVETSGACCSKYGVPNDTSTTRGVRDLMRASIVVNVLDAAAVAVVELMFT
jgi:hypothetical protein